MQFLVGHSRGIRLTKPKCSGLMKVYTFAPIAVREYPVIGPHDRPYLWGGVKLCINLSEKPYPPPFQKALSDQGIQWVHCPITDDPDSEWLDALSRALPKMYSAFRLGWNQVIHTDGGTKSQTFVEALYYAVKKTEYDEPYNGVANHLAFNCREGHLPDLPDMERRIRSMIGPFPKWSLLSEEQMRRRLLSPSNVSDPIALR